jgi:hypothetical protein
LGSISRDPFGTRLRWIERSLAHICQRPSATAAASSNRTSRKGKLQHGDQEVSQERPEQGGSAVERARKSQENATRSAAAGVRPRIMDPGRACPESGGASSVLEQQLHRPAKTSETGLGCCRSPLLDLPITDPPTFSTDISTGSHYPLKGRRTAMLRDQYFFPPSFIAPL